MTEESNYEEEPVKRSSGSGRKALVVLLFLLLAGSVGGNYFLWQKEQSASKRANNQLDSLQEANLIKDSLYQVISMEEAVITNLRQEVAYWQGNNDSIQSVLGEKIKFISSLRRQVANAGGSPSRLKALTDSLNAIKLANGELKTQVQTLLSENQEYKRQLDEKNEKLSVLNNQNMDLSAKVDIAGQPKFGPVHVIPQYQKKDNWMPQYKASKVKRLKITFDILGNELTGKAVDKEYIVRVKDPNGVVLSNENSTLVDSDKVYTLKEQVTFKGTQIHINEEYTQKASYKKGKYSVELKDGAVVVHTFSFTLE